VVLLAVVDVVEQGFCGVRNGVGGCEGFDGDREV
jgi:hypothetical protein